VYPAGPEPKINTWECFVLGAAVLTMRFLGVALFKNQKLADRRSNLAEIMLKIRRLRFKAHAVLQFRLGLMQNYRDRNGLSISFVTNRLHSVDVFTQKFSFTSPFNIL
jgi:hypothetical protein